MRLMKPPLLSGGVAVRGATESKGLPNSLEHALLVAASAACASTGRKHTATTIPIAASAPVRKRYLCFIDSPFELDFRIVVFRHLCSTHRKLHTRQLALRH
jgi:hypothetical protein